MKKAKVWIFLISVSTFGLAVVLSGCFLGPGFQSVTAGASVEGYVYGITNNATVVIKDDLGESTTAAPYSYYYSFSVKPGVRTITYSCTGYATLVKKASVVGQITLNVTMKPIAKLVKGSDSK